MSWIARDKMREPRIFCQSQSHASSPPSPSAQKSKIKNPGGSKPNLWPPERPRQPAHPGQDPGQAPLLYEKILARSTDRKGVVGRVNRARRLNKSERALYVLEANRFAQPLKRRSRESRTVRQCGSRIRQPSRVGAGEPECTRVRRTDLSA